METSFILSLWIFVCIAAVGVMQMFPAESLRRPLFRRRGWLRRLLRGEMRVAGTLRIGATLALILWWCVSSGIVMSALLRSLLILLTGILVLIALLNAGRRETLSSRVHLGLGVLVGTGFMGWLMMAMHSARIFAP